MRDSASTAMRPVFQAPAYDSGYYGYAYGGSEQRSKKKSSKGEKGGLFSPGYPPEVMWSLPYNRRKVDVSGMFGPEDTIVAVAKGMRPGVQSALEYRATIKGGLAVLQAAGLTDVNPSELKVTTLNLAKHDRDLIHAAGLKGEKLKDAAEKIQRDVAKHGKGLARAAWGARGLLILSTLTGFMLARSTAATVLQLFPGIGTIVGAAIAGHGAISGAIAKSLSDRFTGYVKEGLAQYEAERSREVSSSPDPSAGSAPVPVTGSVPSWAWWGGGALLTLLGIAFVARKREEVRS